MDDNKNNAGPTTKTEPSLLAFGISEVEATNFAAISAEFFKTLQKKGISVDAAAYITGGWVTSTIEGVYRVSAETLRRENFQKASEPKDYLENLRK